MLLPLNKTLSRVTVVSRGEIRGMRTYKNAVHPGPCQSSELWSLKNVTAANPGPYTTIPGFYYSAGQALTQSDCTVLVIVLSR